MSILHEQYKLKSENRLKKQHLLKNMSSKQIQLRSQYIRKILFILRPVLKKVQQFYQTKYKIKNQKLNLNQLEQRQMKLNRALPQNLKEPLKVSRFVQMYLLKRQDPFKFIFLDMLNNEFTIQIKQKINCSCLPGYYDHCIHSFYLLQKIFKIKQTDPLLWKQRYSYKDLQLLLESQKNYNIKSRQAKSKQILQRLQNTNRQFEEQFYGQLLKQEQIQEQKQQIQEQTQKIQEKTQKIQEQTQQVTSFGGIYSKSKKDDLKVQKLSSKQFHNQLLKQVQLQLKQQQQQLFGGQELKFCPICHQDITVQTPAYQCKQICKNYYHIKCLKFWVKHQRKNMIENECYDQQHFEHRSNIRVTCPMCRNKLPQNIDSLLNQSENTFKKYYQSHNINCDECKQQVYLKIYHCLFCKNFNLCDNCYKGWKHQHHDRFVMKNNRKQKWSVPQGRSSFSMSKLQFSLEYIKKISKIQNSSKIQGDIKQIFGQNYSKFLQSNQPKPDLIEYLKDSFVNIQKQIHKTYKVVDYNQQSLKCLACKKSTIIGMKRISCTQKHFIDQKCLNFFLKNNFLQCPIDKSYMLQGLQGIQLDLKDMEKNLKKKQNKG